MTALASFRAVAEHPCWGVRPGHGSFLTLEIGAPQLEIREPHVPTPGASAAVRRLLARRRVTVRGQWHLWIHACKWHVFDGDRRIGDWSTQRKRDAAARFLDGQKLIDVTVPSRGARTRFTFDLGGRIDTTPYDRRSEQWLFYEPDGGVLTLRADRRFSHQAGTTAADAVRWKRLP